MICTTMIPRDLNQVLETYRKNGWYPVRWSHHPKPIKEALRAMRFRPRLKECYGNSQRLFLSGLVEGLEYVEGHAGDTIPVPHAWLLYEGEMLDLTMESSAFHSSLVINYTFDQVRRMVIHTECFTSVSVAAYYFTNPINVAFAVQRSVPQTHKDLHRDIMRGDGLTEDQIDGLFAAFDEVVKQRREEV